MGMYLTIYAGSYIKIKDHKEEIEKEITVRGCKKHGEHKNPFCVKCGSPSKEWNKKVKETKSAYDLEVVHCLLEDDNVFTPESLYYEVDAYFIPNKKLKHSRSFDKNDNVEIEFPNKEESVEEIEEVYKNLLKVLRNKYKNKVVIKFGLLTYWH